MAVPVAEPFYRFTAALLRGGLPRNPRTKDASAKDTQRQAEQPR